MKKMMSITVIFALSGCATSTVYEGPGSFQDFANARYQCVRETSARISRGSADQYGAAASTSVKPSCSAFKACLASKGYFVNDNGRFSSESIPVECY